MTDSEKHGKGALVSTGIYSRGTENGNRAQKSSGYKRNISLHDENALSVFDGSGELTDAVFYPVIRNFCFYEEQKEAGICLLNQAVNALSDISADRVYAFFHYFGMSCYARHGKLFEKYTNIHGLLSGNL